VSKGSSTSNNVPKAVAVVVVVSYLVLNPKTDWWQHCSKFEDLDGVDINIKSHIL
jgi:hypothetical protein